MDENKYVAFMEKLKVSKKKRETYKSKYGGNDRTYYVNYIRIWNPLSWPLLLLIGLTTIFQVVILILIGVIKTLKLIPQEIGGFNIEWKW